MNPDALVAMRLIDMVKVHPAQDNTRVCGTCGQRVGIYPSGQRALRDHPGMAIVCQVCALKQPPDEGVPAAPWPEIAEEARQSLPVKRQ